MSTNVNAGIAFIAGIASFVSPCILPLIPAYLSLIGGTSLKDLEEQRPLRWGAVVSTLFFILGFTVVFIALGVLFSSAFGLLGNATEIIDIAAGAIVMLLGVNFIFDFIGVLNFEKRLHMSGKPTSRAGSLLFGMAFGAGWTPCIGPILGSILLLAGSQGSVAEGTLLLLVYSLGLGIPFVLTGFFLSPAMRQLARLKKHLGTIRVASGLFLVLIGLLILLGRLKGFNGFVFGLAGSLDSWQQARPGEARLVVAAVFFACALLIALGYSARIGRNRTKPGDAATPVAHRVVRPARVVFFGLFLALGALAAVGVLNLPQLIAAWLNFQGL